LRSERLGYKDLDVILSKAKDLGEPREEPALSAAEGSRFLGRNNRAFGCFLIELSHYRPGWGCPKA